MSTKNLDMDFLLDKALKKKIEDPNTPESERELAKALLRVSPYEEEKRKKNGNKLKG